MSLGKAGTCVYSSPAGTGSDLPPDAEGPLVPDDASLDDFLPAEDDEPTDSAEDASADDPEAVAEPDDGPTDEGEDQRADGSEAHDSESGDGSADPAAESSEESTDPAADATDLPDADEVAPAVSTYAWAPDGAECGGCGAVVERRWRDGDELVCSDCKEW